VVGVVVVEAVEGRHVARVHGWRRGARDGRVGAVRVAIGRLLGRPAVAEGAWRRRTILRSGLVEDVGIEEALLWECQ
jgi:hypothetical protein